MSALRTYEVEVVFEVTKTFSLRAESGEEAKTQAVREFREWFVEQYDVPPSASELDVYVEEVT